MSLAVPSPHHNKRFLEASEDQALDDGSRVPFTDFNPQKRFRQLASPGGRCASGHRGAYRVGSPTLAAICALFPHMSDKAIAEVLDEFGDNIDAAIKHLNDLQLAAPGSSEQHARQELQRQGILGPAAAPPPAAPAPARPAPPLADAAAPSAAGEAPQPDAARPAPARSAEEWITLMVDQMSAAGDVADARRRAGEVLQAFEQAVLRHVEGQAAPGEARAAEAERENALLKRAVAIQAARLQEGAGREGEAAALRGALEAARARVAALESHNYSLQVHLKQAADGGGRDPLGAARNPHVF